MRPEILAPCGSAESLEAAVRSGADAVYLGAGEFNARRNARNFSPDELKNAVSFCHARGVKVYFTENILVTDRELLSAVETARAACAAGADAVILQDAGLASLIHRAAPGLPIHASTQMTVQDVSGLMMMKKMGFSRVIPARELSLAQLGELCAAAKELSMEVEVFIHGALCMCVSGQCCLSSMIGSRSGNRGLCAQPCRLPFAAEGGSGRDLSLKDMSYISRLGELSAVGVASFKIEGRMKSPEYVAAAVTAARLSRDTGMVPEELQSALLTVFSRAGFTDGYLDGRTGPHMFGMRTEDDKKLSDDVKSSLHELYRNEFGRVTVDMQAVCRLGEKASLTVSDREGRSVTVFGEPPERALSRPIDGEYVASRLSKCGGTPFVAGEITLETDNNSFLTAAALNSLRREALDVLLAERSRREQRVFDEAVLPEKPPETQRSRPVVRTRFSGRIPEGFSGVDGIILPWNLPDGEFIKAMELVEWVAVELPRTPLCGTGRLADRLKELRSLGVRNAVSENWGAAELALSLGFSLHGGMFSQIMNSASASKAAELGMESVTLSFETTLSDAQNLASPVPKGLAVYGYFPLMLTKNCPLRNGRSCKDCEGGFLTDRRDTKFFVRCRDGASELFNSVPTVMYDRPDELLGLDFVTYYFTRETDEEILSVLSGKMPEGGHTRGLYYRGVS